MRTHLRLLFGFLALVLATTFAKAQWSEIPPLPITVSWPMTAEAGGKIYCFGGLLSSTGSRSVYVYTPGATEWVKVSALMPKGKWGGYAATINGKIYIVGGLVVSGSSSAVNGETYEFDPVAETFTTKKAMTTTQRVGYFAGAVSGNKVYVIGGYNGTADVTNIQVYDPATDTWTTSTSKAPYTGRYAASTYMNGKIFMMGGGATSYISQAWMGTPNDVDATVAWERIANLPSALTRGSAGVTNGKVVFSGGAPVLTEGYSNTYIYNQTSDDWEISYALPASTYNAGQLFGTGNDLYFVGGYLNDKSFKFTYTDAQNPSVVMDAQPIFFNLEQGKAAVSGFNMQNLGVVPLTVSIAIPEGASAWLTTAQANGSVDALATESFSLNLFAGTLSAGLYKADVVITTNDPTRTTITLPVMMYVLPQGISLQSTKVVIEEGTGDWCGYCPQGHEVVQEIKENLEDAVIPLSYHGGGALGTVQFMIAEGQKLIDDLNIQGYPNAAINRLYFPGEPYQMVNRGSWSTYAETVLEQMPNAPVSINLINYQFNETSRTVTAKVEVERSMAMLHDANGGVRLTAIVVESGLIGWQNDYRLPPPYRIDEYEHNHVVHQLYPDERGMDIALPAANILEGAVAGPGDKVTVDMTFTVSDEVVDFNKSQIVFLANWVGGASELGPILQAHERALKSTASVKRSDEASNVTVSNFPNPVAKKTTFTYSVSEPSVVSLAVYDIMGREVSRVISNESHATGTYETDLNASNLSNGTYTYVLSAGMQKVTGTMIVQK